MKTNVKPNVSLNGLKDFLINSVVCVHCDKPPKHRQMLSSFYSMSYLDQVLYSHQSPLSNRFPFRFCQFNGRGKSDISEEAQSATEGVFQTHRDAGTQFSLLETSSRQHLDASAAVTKPNQNICIFFSHISSIIS